MDYNKVWADIEEKALVIRSKALKQGISLREGQALFNATAVEYPELAQSLAGKPCDCFYSDTNIPEFAVAVMSHFGYKVDADENS